MCHSRCTEAIKEIPTHTGPLMSLGKRVLSGGAASEAEVRQYVREFEPSEAAHPLLALNEYAQLNTMAAPGARVRYVTEGNTLEWRLESGALLRCWKPYEGVCNSRPSELVPAMHHEGVVGDERLVSVEFAGSVLGFKGPRPLPGGWLKSSTVATRSVRREAFTAIFAFTAIPRRDGPPTTAVVVGATSSIHGGGCGAAGRAEDGVADSVAYHVIGR